MLKNSKPESNLRWPSGQKLKHWHRSGTQKRNGDFQIHSLIELTGAVTAGSSAVLGVWIVVNLF
jgi:hypothetical protein